MEWGGFAYKNGMRTYVLRLELIIFTAIADALEWSIRLAGVVHASGWSR